MRSKGLLLASQWLLLRSALGSRPADSDAEGLGPAPRKPVPSYLEDAFPGPSKVRQTWQDLQKQNDKIRQIVVDNLFSVSTTTGKWKFKYDLEDKGDPYELGVLLLPAAISRTAETSFRFKLPKKIAKVNLEARFLGDLPTLKQFDTYLEEGINYAGRITVSGGDVGGEARHILVPGTKTYDVGGMTGDPHASERIGPACSKVIMAITTAVVAAMRATGSPFFVRGLFASNHQLIEDLHNRWTLATYMWDQAYAAFTGRARVTYATYVKSFLPALTQQPCFNELKSEQLGRCHDHTKEYMEDSTSPPQKFYAKICEDLKKPPNDNGEWKKTMNYNEFCAKT